MNFKAITGPLGERIGAITELVQEMIDTNKEQTEIQKKILVRLDDIDEKLHKENICKTPEADKQGSNYPL